MQPSGAQLLNAGEIAALHAINPDYARAILDNWKAEGEHRRSMEAQEMDITGEASATQATLTLRGQPCALIAFIATLVLAGYFGHLGLPWLAGGTFLADLGLIVSLFLRERREGNDEPKATAEEPKSLPAPRT